LRRRKLCFTCQESWAPRNICAVGKAHYIKVFSHDEEDEEEEPEGGHNAGITGEDTPPRGGNGASSPIGGALASLRGVPKYLILRVQGSILDQRVSVFIYSGATHNFIDTQLVQRREIPTDDFEGFSVLDIRDRTMECMHYVPSLSGTMGTFTLNDHLFLAEIPDTNVILRVQLLITLGNVTTDWVNLQMEWVHRKSGKNQMIRGMHTYTSQTTSTQKK